MQLISKGKTNFTYLLFAIIFALMAGLIIYLIPNCPNKKVVITGQPAATGQNSQAPASGAGK